MIKTICNSIYILYYYYYYVESTQQNEKKKHQRIGRKWRKTLILAIKINRQNKGNEINLELITYNVLVLPIAVWCGALRIIIISSGTFFFSIRVLNCTLLNCTLQNNNRTKQGIYMRKKCFSFCRYYYFSAHITGREQAPYA